MIGREEPAPLVWRIDASNGNKRWCAIGKWMAIVWHVGGTMPWRSMLRHNHDEKAETRKVPHVSESDAKRAAEKRLRKAAS